MSYAVFDHKNARVKASIGGAGGFRSQFFFASEAFKFSGCQKKNAVENPRFSMGQPVAWKYWPLPSTASCISLGTLLSKSPMNHIKAIGFDLFNTLITVEPQALKEAMSRLVRSLRKSGLAVESEPFKQAHRNAALRFLKEAQRDGRETHNRFWISAALNDQEYSVPPDDDRIAVAVEAYFSAFYEHCHLIPGTTEMLGTLKEQYPLGLLSNFTHGPAAREIIDRVGLNLFFDVVLISGELGYRKPHPLVFRRLVEHLGVDNHLVLYVGDDPEPDITGAQRAGLQPVWTTFVRDHNLPLAPGIPYSTAEGLDDSVPRISTWRDLLSLLEKG